MRDDVINELKDVVRRHVLRVAPGLLGLIGLLTTKRYGMGVVDLLFTSPTKLYVLLIEYYKGDVNTASFTFKFFFLGPIATQLGDPLAANDLLEYVERGDDEGFLNYIREALRAS